MSLPSYRKRLMGDKKLYHALQKHRFMIEDSFATSQSLEKDITDLTSEPIEEEEQNTNTDVYGAIS